MRSNAPQNNPQVLVVVVTVVDNSRVELVLVLHDNFVDVVCNHGGAVARLRVDIGVEVVDHVGKGLFGLLVQVGHGNTSSKDSVVGVLRGLLDDWEGKERDACEHSNSFGKHGCCATRQNSRAKQRSRRPSCRVQW